MAELIFQTADWKTEKHVPVIESPDTVNNGGSVKITVKVGKEIPHPNTAEHHIKSIEIYYLIPEEKFPVQVARFEFNAHGESVRGPDTGMVYSEPEASVSFKVAKSGMIVAISYCNIHGVWKSVKDLKVQ